MYSNSEQVTQNLPPSVIISNQNKRLNIHEIFSSYIMYNFVIELTSFDINFKSINWIICAEIVKYPGFEISPRFKMAAPSAKKIAPLIKIRISMSFDLESAVCTIEKE